MLSQKSAVLVLVAAVALFAPGQARAPTAQRAVGEDADDSEPPMVTETDPKYKIPDNFLIGAGSAAYQSEGAWNKDGKGESVFDRYYHSGSFATNMTGDIACNSYERFEEDMKLAAEMGLNSFRFSIAWTRIFPDGDINNKNEKGVQYYHNLIKAIKAHNMKPVVGHRERAPDRRPDLPIHAYTLFEIISESMPFCQVTIYHFDHPQALQDKFGGWLSDQMIQSFTDFADFLFSEYGKEVEYWLTLNEPNMHCIMVYNGALAPDLPKAQKTSQNVYKCIHNEILAHAAAYRLYERKYRKDQGGRVGIGALTFFARPNSTKWDDILAAERANYFEMGLIINPIVFGEYPDVVRETLARAGKLDHLPTFTDAQKREIKGASDFFGINSYFGMTVADPNKGGHSTSPVISGGVGPRNENNVTIIAIGDSNDPQPDTSTDVFGKFNPWVLRDMGLWMKARYGPVAVLITENGMAISNEDSLDDWDSRAVYHSAYLRGMMQAVNEDGANYIGYSQWSFLDDFEWSAGYTRNFGLVHVDYKHGTLDRTPKRSSHFFKRMMKDRSVPLVLPSRSADTSAAGPGAALPSALTVLLAAALSLLSHDSS
ncbi:Beta-glucosidase 6 [Frankliniella fusca]|uniref:beta-glucosidase n=1 Tax=Frankliniella fusca TaxID=407009 RepID=A0AAE1LF54_9NEOP|nr:Beta-glucosidase 6 [Frankliniella fusca]